ncbi:MAG: VOC family protein [Pseudomonadota bacterium]
MSPSLLQVSIIVDDPGAVVGFYCALFEAQEEHTVNPEGYRGVVLSGGIIGFNEPAARGKLGLSGSTHVAERSSHDQGYFTVKVDEDGEVDQLIKKAMNLGATLLKGPLTTPFNWYIAVLRDPHGIAFRLASTRGPIRPRRSVD